MYLALLKIDSNLGGIIGGKKTPLVLWEKKDWDTITAVSYVQHASEPVMVPFKEERNRKGQYMILMEDGARAHTAKYTTAFCEQHNIPELQPWPPSFPDLNPIEHLWQQIKQNVNKKKRSELRSELKSELKSELNKCGV